MTEFIKKSDYLAVATQIVERVHTASLTHLIELFRLYTGTKQVVRLVVTDDEFRAIQALVRQLKVSIFHAEVRLCDVEVSGLGDTFVIAVDWDDPRGRRFAIYLGNEAQAKHCSETESKNDSSQQLGQLLGIPACCAEAYRYVQQGVPWLSIWLEGVKTGMLFPAAGNHLASYISQCNPAGDYLPCHLTCEETVANARHGMEAARFFGLDDLIIRVSEAQSFPVVVDYDDLLFLVKAEPEVQCQPHRPCYRSAPGAIIFLGPRRKKFKILLGNANRIQADAESVFFFEEKQLLASLRTSLASNPTNSLADFHHSHNLHYPIVLQFRKEQRH